MSRYSSLVAVDPLGDSQAIAKPNTLESPPVSPRMETLKSSDLATDIAQGIRFLTKEQIAARYQVSVACINKWMAARRLPFLRISHRVVRFDVHACDKALTKFEVRSR